MSDGPRDNNVLAEPVCVLLCRYAKDVSKVLGNTRFLSDDDDRHVSKGRRRLYLNPPLVLR